MSTIFEKTVFFRPVLAIKPVIRCAGASDTVVTWTSDDETVAAVTPSEDSSLVAVVTGKKAGTAHITALSEDGPSAVFTLTVICSHVNTVSHEAVPSTCSVPGHGAYVVCADCGTVIEGSDEALPPAPHDWGEVSYSWAEDLSTLTASRVCRNDASHVETETVAVTATVTRPATEEEGGEVVYTSAAFENAAFSAQTKTVATDPLKPAFVWGDANGDGKITSADIIRLKNYLANFDYDAGMSSNGTKVYTLGPAVA